MNQGAFHKGFGVFDRLGGEDYLPDAPVFTNEETLDQNIKSIEARGGVAEDPKIDFYWQYHIPFRTKLRSILAVDKPITDKITGVKRLIERNQRAYVLLRRVTLFLFLLLAVLAAPAGIKSDKALLACCQSMLDGAYAAAGPASPAMTWFLFVAALFVVSFVCNRIIKSFYDNSVEQTANTLANHLQSYTNHLYTEGFKKAMDAIDKEEAIYSDDNVKDSGPSRAEKWARIAYWHGKRLEWISRYAHIEIWATQRTLRAMDHVSRALTALIFVIFAIAFLPVTDRAATDVLSMMALALLGLLVWYGWDNVGKEDTDPLKRTHMGEAQQKWRQDAGIAENFAEQVHKDKAKILDYKRPRLRKSTDQ
ncbi:hypothetical protein [Aquisalinus flavus]|uniref:hypothetical protein n=1 Tax=Aquisalinus flavus TaxID=1526572 RepID=UPI00165FBEBA|nr:hypothetical protein [Aquisalinus flavus]MBD0425543.1 hypothetical protein [Aquisalinus flavus]UNE48830.1 hypothetical protein FF099_12610 [Aquisalinus flavus]